MMLVRTASEWDAHKIVECLHEAFAPYREQYTHDGFHDTVLDHESVMQRLREMTVFVAVDTSGEIVGTAGCGCRPPEEAHIRGMAVRPAWQGRGVAEALLKAAEERAREMGCRRVALDTTEVLHRAMRFYERNGYRRTGRIGDFFGMPLHEFAKEVRT